MLINKIHEEVYRTPWLGLKQIAFACNTTPESVSSTLTRCGTSFNKLKAQEIQKLKNFEINSKSFLAKDAIDAMRAIK